MRGWLEPTEPVRTGSWGRVRTVWSDDSVTLSEVMPYIWCQIDLAIYGMADVWIGQVRPVRAVIVDVHEWPLEAEVILQ
jgi:hypothetical protein